MHYDPLPYEAKVFSPAKHAPTVARKMTKMAGGSTQRPAWGEWLDAAGEVVAEPMMEVVGYFKDKQLAQLAAHDQIEYLLMQGEKAVLYEVRGPDGYSRSITSREAIAA